MSQLHFVAAVAYEARVVQWGNKPETVFNVGALGCDKLKKRKWKQLKPKQILIAYYPEFESDNNNLENLLSIIAEKEFQTVVFIKGCYDLGHLGYHYLLDDYDIDINERYDSINRK